MKHLFVINPKSFAINNQMDAVMVGIKNYFQNQHGNEHTIYFSRYPRDSVTMIKKFLSKTADMVRVYAVGGDGILLDCLNGVVDMPNAELASIPYGNSNNFIRSFGDKSVGLFKDIRLQATSPAIPTDVIYCSGNYALNYCSVGLESKAVPAANRIYKNLNKNKQRISIGASYFLGGLSSIFAQDMMNQYYEISIDGKSYDGNYGAVCLFNGACYGGDMRPAPDALTNDGLLDIMLIKSIGIYKYVFVMNNYVKGRYKKHPLDISHICGKNISVRSKFPLFISLDGEIYSDTNIDVHVCPSAINFVSANNMECIFGKEQKKA